VIPCLNDREDFAQVLTNMINEWALYTQKSPSSHAATVKEM